MWKHQPVLGTPHFSGCKPQAALGGGQHPHSTDKGVSSQGEVTCCRQQRAGPAPGRPVCLPPSAPAGTPQLPFCTPKVKHLPSPFPWTKLLLLFISASWQPRPIWHPCWGCPRVPVYASLSGGASWSLAWMLQRPPPSSQATPTLVSDGPSQHVALSRRPSLPTSLSVDPHSSNRVRSSVSAAPERLSPGRVALLSSSWGPALTLSPSWLPSAVGAPMQSVPTERTLPSAADVLLLCSRQAPDPAFMPGPQQVHGTSSQALPPLRSTQKDRCAIVFPHADLEEHQILTGGTVTLRP